MLPASHLETPEVRGKGAVGRVELIGLMAGSDLVATPDTATQSDGSTTATVQKNTNGAFGFVLALSDKFDAGIRLQPQTPMMMRLKYQISGVPEAQAKQGDFSTAVSASPGLLFGGNGTTPVTYFLGDLSFLMGYRIRAEDLISLSPFFSFANLSGLSQNAAGTTGAISPNQLGLNFGYQHQIHDLFIRTELSYAKGSVGGSKISGLFLGAMVGLGL